MGFTKWIFRNGIGSIGSNAKAWTKIYLKTINSEPKPTNEEAFAHVLLNYYWSNSKVGIKYAPSNTVELLEFCNDSLVLFIWALLCELPSNVKALISGEKDLLIAIEVVYEVVKETAPNRVVTSQEHFTTMAIKYVTHRNQLLLNE